MSRHVLRAAALAAALLPAGWAAAAPLSLDQAIDLAVERSALARSARAGALSAAELARAAGQQPDPMLSAGIDNLPATGRNAFNPATEDMTMKRIGISQEWVSAEKRAAREAVGHAMAERDAAAESAAAAEARLEVALAYIDAYYAGESLALTTLGEHHVHEEFEAAKGRLAAAAGSSTEVLALASTLGAAQDESAEARQQQGAALAMLQRWVGRAADELKPPMLKAMPSLDEYVALSPAVVARQHELAVARRETEATRLNRRPNWTYELSYGQRQGRPDMVSFGVTIPWPVAPAARQDRETAASLALVDKAEAELEEARRAAAGEYAALSSDAKRLRERIERYEGTVLVPLRQRTAAALAAYRAGQSGLMQLFEARHAEVEAQRKSLGLQRDLARAQAQLAFKPIAQGAAR